MSAEETEAIGELLYLMGPIIDGQTTLAERESNQSAIWNSEPIPIFCW